MTEGGTAHRDPVERGALALQRVLALEGRNALARVELAASELLQLEARPAARDRLAAIRDAVGALDDVLDKIERLADPRREPDERPGVPLARVWGPLAERIAPALRARGIVLETAATAGEVVLALPAAELERLLLLFVRVVVAAIAAAEPEGADEPVRVVFEQKDEAEHGVAWLRVLGTRAAQPLGLERADRVELEVALARVGGALIEGPAAELGSVGLRLARVTRDA